MSDDYSDIPMEELFRAEAEGQCTSLANDLLEVEKAADPAPILERLMRAAHSLKGAARIIGVGEAVKVAHSMEECFVNAQKKNEAPSCAAVDVLLRGVDLLKRLSGVIPGAVPSEIEVAEFSAACKNLPTGESPARQQPQPSKATAAELSASATERRDVRLDAERLDTLLGYAGQALVTANPDDREVHSLRFALRQLQATLSEAVRTGDETHRMALLRQGLGGVQNSQALLSAATESADLRGRRLLNLCSKIYNETLAARMRPFGDITSGLRRMARDLARDLGKEVEIEVSGEDTEVDRDLLDRLDGPLSHLIRNALDHGLETPDERVTKGKSPGGWLQISARHQAGWLVVSIADDGRGPDLERIKKAIVRRKLAAEELVERMSEAELLEFLLLPGFSLKETVTEISGRGVGLDAVRAMAHGTGGGLRLGRHEAGGFLSEIILPVSLSLVRSLVLRIGGDFFALPLSRVDRVLHVSPEDIHAAAGRQHIFVDGEQIQIMSAAQVLELDDPGVSVDRTPVVIIPGPEGKLGLTFERFEGQRELSIQRLDARLGGVQDVSATSLFDNGEPVIVLDANDLAVTATNFSSGTRYRPLTAGVSKIEEIVRRILVADDSLTVRELERKLLAGRGYHVETAIDGADAWNALRVGAYDLLVTDIDMPRLDGVELVRRVRADARLRDLPVIVVSYKDREEDRARGLEAGADFYLPKSSYQDQSLLNAVLELIGEPVAT